MSIRLVSAMVFVVSAFAFSASADTPPADEFAPINESAVEGTIMPVEPTFEPAESATAVASSTVTIEVSDLRNANGILQIAVYNQAKGFPDHADPLMAKKVKITSKSMKVELEPLPSGKQYAFVIGHDENGNGDIDSGTFGIPKEGFGFSNNPKIGTSAPSFKSCAVDVNQPDQKVSIHAIYCHGISCK